MKLEKIRAQLQEGFWKEIIIKDEISSTNDLLRELAEAGAPEGTVVIAEKQTSGRGRMKRKWLSPPGGAWFSILLRPKIAPDKADHIAMLLAAAVASSLNEWLKILIKVKWPNDLILNDKKLGGILIELATKADRIDFLIAGIGVNVNNAIPEEIKATATSLKEELGHEVPLEEFFAVVLDGIAREYRSLLMGGAYDSPKSKVKKSQVKWLLDLGLTACDCKGSDLFASHSCAWGPMGR